MPGTGPGHQERGYHVREIVPTNLLHVFCLHSLFLPSFNPQVFQEKQKLKKQKRALKAAAAAAAQKHDNQGNTESPSKA
jgi:hemoglobin-like flavoprotein